MKVRLSGLTLMPRSGQRPDRAGRSSELLTLSTARERCPFGKSNPP